MRTDVHPTAAGAAAVKRRKGKGTCQVCARSITVRPDGMPARTHNRMIEHNHKVKHFTECHGSRLPSAEYVAAYNAARATYVATS